MIQLPIGSPEFRPTMTLAQLETEYTLKTLEYFNGDIRLTAKALGVARSTFYSRIKAMKIKRSVSYK
jgi:transcriptional regulator of acetoin/glycerol metabolism